MRKLVAGCPSCEEFMRGVDESKIIDIGRLFLQGVGVDWIVVESGKKSVDAGKHLIMTTTSHHVGEHDVLMRARLTSKATTVAYGLLGEDHRIVVNSGLRASTRTHWHAHLISPGEGERLPRVVANIPKALQEAKEKFGLSEEVIDFLDKAIMQQK